MPKTWDPDAAIVCLDPMQIGQTLSHLKAQGQHPFWRAGGTGIDQSLQPRRDPHRIRHHKRSLDHQLLISNGQEMRTGSQLLIDVYFSPKALLPQLGQLWIFCRIPTHQPQQHVCLGFQINRPKLIRCGGQQTDPALWQRLHQAIAIMDHLIGQKHGRASRLTVPLRSAKQTLLCCSMVSTNSGNGIPHQPGSRVFT